jgi:hypothetical protein
LVIGDIKQVAGDADGMLHRPGQNSETRQPRTVEAAKHVGGDVAVQHGGLQGGTIDEHRGNQRVERRDALIVPGPYSSEPERA